MKCARVHDDATGLCAGIKGQTSAATLPSASAAAWWRCGSSLSPDREGGNVPVAEEEDEPDASAVTEASGAAARGIADGAPGMIISLQYITFALSHLTGRAERVLERRAVERRRVLRRRACEADCGGAIVVVVVFVAPAAIRVERLACTASASAATSTSRFCATSSSICAAGPWWLGVEAIQNHLFSLTST